MRWKGRYTDKETVAWDVYDDEGKLCAYAIQQNGTGRWKVRVHGPPDAHPLSPYLMLDDDPKIFMPHPLMTLYGAQQ
jgi:hypothetical protein